MSEQAISFGTTAQETLPDLVGLYNGYEIDSYILANHSVMTKENRSGDPHAGLEDSRRFAELVRYRHATLSIPEKHDSGNLYNSVLLSMIDDITDIWHAAYLSPRLAPLPEHTYVEWLATWLGRSGTIALDKNTRKLPWKAAARKPQLALADIALEPLLGARSAHIMIPPTVQVSYNDLGHSTLLCSTGETPVISNTHSTIPLYEGMAEWLHLEYGVPLERLQNTVF